MAQNSVKSWAWLEQLVSSKSYSSVSVLVDENTAVHCWPLAVKMCGALRNAKLFEVPAGESSKDIQIAYQLWSAFIESGMDRQSLLINLGGGMITDLGGFLASTYQRGIDFINLPTSLLGMIDASIGGKTGINIDHYKNMAGTFSEARGVVVEVAFLQSLPKRELLSGFAEMIKHGIISGGNHWENIRELRDVENSISNELIASSMKVKTEIVNADFKESGIRKTLNLGHSIGHAIESLSLDTSRTLLHGEAIAVGILTECKISQLMGISREDDYAQIKELILRHFSNLALPETTIEDLMNRLLMDKKNHNSSIRMSLPKGIGNVLINQEPKTKIIKDSWEEIQQLFNA